jgi:hypothetical protein
METPRAYATAKKNGNSLMVWLQADGQKLPTSKDSLLRTALPENFEACTHSTAQSCHGYHLQPPAQAAHFTYFCPP